MSSALPADLLHRVQRASDLARDTHLRVPTAFAELLPEGGLRRGTITTVSGVGATSLALGLVSTADAWTACVGLEGLGPLAARELGLDLERLALIPRPGKAWAEVVAALVDACEVVLVSSQASGRDARRIAARVRERGTVLVAVGGWEGSSEVGLRTTGVRWTGAGDGHGHLRARAITVEVSSRRRGAAARGALWLPGPDGRIGPAAGQALRAAR